MNRKLIGVLIGSTMISALVALSVLNAQSPKSEGACTACHVAFKACELKAENDFSGFDKRKERQAAIGTCRKVMLNCASTCKDCKKTCEESVKAGKERCENDFDANCSMTDFSCKASSAAETKACVASVETDCKTQCKVQ